MKHRWKGKFMKASKQERIQDFSLRGRDRAEEYEEGKSEADIHSSERMKSGWGDGRRIIDLRHLADNLRACKYCGKPLLLHNIEREQRIGYASILYITCDCGLVNSVTTGKSHRPPEKTKKGMPVYDINTKAVLGVMHAGITYRQMNGLMATMEIKGLHHTAMMRRREEVDPHIQNVARDSCAAALSEEGDLCENPTGNSESSREGIFKYDMGWQKRGSGRAYDSKSGVGTLIGNTSGKICAFGIRVSDCRTCSNFETEKTPSHKCSKNWSGSAKAMESDVGVDLIKSVEKEGVRVKTLIMDDDTTTMAKVRRELDHTITKWSDVNHTSKHLTNSLFSLQKKHKCLSNIVIAYLKKCFNYALSQTKGNQEQCKLHIQQIVPHSFGEHENCSEWCRHTINPETYEHKTLPKDLTGEVLRSDLEAVFNVFAQNAEKIAPGGSTKDVESFNNMVASKAPKRCHFSASGNLNSRVGCAVAQKNLGNSYINTINERILLSPGIIYSEEATRRDSERKRQKLYTNKRENKLRKLQNKLKKRHVQSAKEKTEGKTYQTAIATITDNENNFIPVHRHPPKSQQVSCSQNLVFCDIETGSLYKDCDILQIAACSDGEHFNQYITPKKLISYAASKVNGLTTQGGVLFLHGSPVLSLPLKASLELFLDWISGIGAVVLVGHNFKVFDFPRLIRAFRITSLETKFHTVCLGGIDTLPIFKSLYPDSENHKQEYLCEKILQQKYSAHNALDDVINLEKLFRCTSVSSDILQKHSFTTNWGFQQHDFQEETARNNETLHILIQNKIVSKQTSYKIASSGLSYRNLQYVCQQDGELGLSHLLGDKSCGETRVTSCKRIIHSIYEYLSSCTSHL